MFLVARASAPGILRVQVSLRSIMSIHKPAPRMSSARTTFTAAAVAALAAMTLMLCVTAIVGARLGFELWPALGREQALQLEVPAVSSIDVARLLPAADPLGPLRDAGARLAVAAVSPLVSAAPGIVPDAGSAPSRTVGSAAPGTPPAVSVRGRRSSVGRSPSRTGGTGTARRLPVAGVPATTPVLAPTPAPAPAPAPAPVIAASAQSAVASPGSPSAASAHPSVTSSSPAPGRAKKAAPKTSAPATKATAAAPDPAPEAAAPAPSEPAAAAAREPAGSKASPKSEKATPSPADSDPVDGRGKGSGGHPD